VTRALDKSNLKLSRYKELLPTRGKNFFKNPVYNEPPLYDYRPAGHPSMPPQQFREQG